MITKRQRRLEANKLLKKPETDFYLIDLSEANFVRNGMTRAFRNNRYTVMIYDRTITDKGICTKALIQNHTDTPIINHWSELQRIKNEIFGKETTAIEYYPAENELINDHNIYWLWIFPAGILPKTLF